MSTTRRSGLDIDSLSVSVETLSLGTDAGPYDATPWIVNVRDGVDSLLTLGVVQMLRPSGNPRPAAASLFGEPGAEVAFSVVTSTRTGSGDLIVVQANPTAQMADEDVVAAYALLRAMVVLRAGAAHMSLDILDELVGSRLGATAWGTGSTVFLRRAIAEQEPLLDLLCHDRRGLHLVRGA